MIGNCESVTCNNCGEVHVAVTREYAVNQVAEFNRFYETLHIKQKGHYGGPAKVENYEVCKGCGGSYKEFRDYKEGDCPEGCTINPVLGRDE